MLASWVCKKLLVAKGLRESVPATSLLLQLLLLLLLISLQGSPQMEGTPRARKRREEEEEEATDTGKAWRREAMQS